LYELRPPYTQSTIDVANALFESGLVEWANPNYSYAVKQSNFGGEPNDDLYDQQWNLSKIRANRAWDITTGTDVNIAIFDDGVDLTHTDLEDNLLKDGSGNVIGYNSTNRGSSDDPHPDGGDAHGTNCAGIAAAVTNNDEGVAGILIEGRIMPLQMSYTHPYYGSPYIETIVMSSMECRQKVVF
jgi:thermitase